MLAGIIDGGGTNGVMFTSVHLWPFSYAGQPNSFCNVLKDTRGYPFYLPETGKYWAGPMTSAAIGGSHAFAGIIVTLLISFENNAFFSCIVDLTCSCDSTICRSYVSSV